MFTRIFVAGLLLALAGPVFAGEIPATQPSSKAQPAWDLLKTIVGEWKTADGAKQKAAVSYKLIAADSAIMESMDCMGGGMVSMYHLDNDNLMMTHYCPAKNQPRMRAEPFKAGDKSITFNFFDGTNIPTPKAGHMEKVVITFIDADHMNQDWTFVVDGKPMEPVTLKYERITERTRPSAARGSASP